MIKKFLEAKIKSVNKEEGTFEVIASSGKVDRLGDTIDPKGWYLKNYKKNPVILWSHSSGGFLTPAVPPVAKADKTWVEDKKILKQKGSWAPTVFAQELRTLVEGGFLNTVSVGFLPLVEDIKGIIEIGMKMYRRLTELETKSYIEKGQVTINDKLYGKNGEHFTKQELLEVSWVNVPALPDALVSARKMNLALVTKALENEIKENPKEEEEKKTETEKETDHKEIKIEPASGKGGYFVPPGKLKEDFISFLKDKKIQFEPEDILKDGGGDYILIKSDKEKELTTNQFDKVKEFISETEKAISVLKGILPKTDATPADDTKGRKAEKQIKSQAFIDREAEIKLLRLADKAIEALLRKLRQ